MQDKGQRLARPAAPLAAFVQRIRIAPYANAIYRISPKLNSVDKANEKWLPRQRPFSDRKANLSWVICIHVCSTRLEQSTSRHHWQGRPQDFG